MLDARINELHELRETGELSDICVTVDEIQFHLHKFPLFLNSDFFRALCRCGMIDEDRVTLSQFPGGASTFSLVADYCYGKDIKIDYTNVAQLRCAADFLQMTSPGNLASETSMALLKILRSAPQLSVSEVVYVLSRCCRLGEIASHTYVLSSCFSAVLEIWKEDGLPELILEIIQELPVEWFAGLIVTARDNNIPIYSMTSLVNKYLETVIKERETTIDKYFNGDSITSEDAIHLGVSRKPREDHNNIGDILDSILLELPDDAPLHQVMDPRLICLLYRLAGKLNCKCEAVLFRAVCSILSSIPPETLVTMTLDNISAMAEYIMQNDIVPPEIICHIIDAYLRERIKRKAIDIDEFKAVLQILPKDYRKDHNSLLNISEELFATKDLTDETKLEILNGIDPKRLHEDILKRTSQRNLIPSEFIVKSALALSSRLRNELTEARSELENKTKAIGEMHLSVTDVIEGQWQNKNITINVTPKDTDNTRVQFAKVLERNTSKNLLMEHEEFEGKLTLCVRPSRATPTQEWFLFDPFNEQLIEMKRSKYDSLIVGENYKKKKHTTSYWPFNVS